MKGNNIKKKNDESKEEMKEDKIIIINEKRKRVSQSLESKAKQVV